MIVDLGRFVSAERAYWDELEAALRKLEQEPERRMAMEEVRRLHYLYERCSADLARLDTFAADPGLRGSLEGLVARAYSVIHETREPVRVQWKNLVLAFPRAFRRHLRAFRLAAAALLVGCAFGWFAVRQDARARAVLMPFPGLMNSPAERVAREESAQSDRLKGVKATFSAQLMNNNIRVAMLALALGITWGAGTMVVLFFNGVILGAVAGDYVAAGQATFLTAWLLPHGSAEIPAILVGGQAGFVVAGALIGWGRRTTRRERFREAAPDLLALIAGAAGLLVWAGLVEAFVSQYHQPVIPYGLKIAFGACELAALAAFLGLAGRK